MATTTNYSWTTPDDTDLVKDGAAAIRTLGSSADTTVGNLNPGTTAGDIDYYTTSTAKARIGIGTEGQLLGIDAGVPAWVTPPSGAPTTEFARVDSSQTTTSTSYTDLSTSGPAVTITTGTKALVIVSAQLSNQNSDIAYAYMSYATSGATTIAAGDGVAVGVATTVSSGHNRVIASKASRVTLTAGSNTFTAKYRVTTSTGTFVNREIFVMDLGS
jgi:hypothetical protein